MNATQLDVEELRSAISYVQVALTILAVFVVAVTVIMALIYVRWGTQIMSLEDIRRLTKSHLMVAESVAKSTKQEVVKEVASIKEMAVPNGTNSGILSGDQIRVHE